MRACIRRDVHDFGVMYEYAVFGRNIFVAKFQSSIDASTSSPAIAAILFDNRCPARLFQVLERSISMLLPHWQRVHRGSASTTTIARDLV